MSAKHIIRQIDLADIPSIFILGREVYDWIFEKSSWSITAISWFVEYHSDTCFVAVADGKIRGFLLSFIMNKTGYLAWIAVEKDYRNIGIAKSLIHKTIDSLKNRVDLISAHVRKEVPVFDIMSRMGFVATDEIKIEMILTDLD